MIDTTILAYMAGLFDGEGSVTIGRRNPVGRRTTPQYVLQVQLVNTYEPIMHWTTETFGGRLSEVRHDAKYARAWKWVLRCRKARVFLEQVYPYLRIKREQASIGIELQRHIEECPKEYNGRGYREPISEGVLAFRQGCKDRLLASRLKDHQRQNWVQTGR